MAKPLTSQEMRNQDIAISKRDRMAEIEAQYLRGLKYRESEDFKADQIRALKDVKDLVGPPLGKANSMEMALYRMGMIQQILDGVYRHERIIIEYEGLKKALRGMYPP